MTEKLPGKEQTEILANEAVRLRGEAVAELDESKGKTPSMRQERASTKFLEAANYYKDGGVTHQAMIEYGVAGMLTRSPRRREQAIDAIENLGKTYGYERYKDQLVKLAKSESWLPDSPQHSLIRAEELSEELRKAEDRKEDQAEIQRLKNEVDNAYEYAGLGKGFGAHR